MRLTYNCCVLSLLVALNGFSLSTFVVIELPSEVSSCVSLFISLDFPMNDSFQSSITQQTTRDTFSLIFFENSKQMLKWRLLARRKAMSLTRCNPVDVEHPENIFISLQNILKHRPNHTTLQHMEFLVF